MAGLPRTISEHHGYRDALHARAKALIDLDRLPSDEELETEVIGGRGSHRVGETQLPSAIAERQASHAFYAAYRAVRLMFGEMLTAEEAATKIGYRLHSALDELEGARSLRETALARYYVDHPDKR